MSRKKEAHHLVCVSFLWTVGFYLKFFLFALQENSYRPPSPFIFLKLNLRLKRLAQMHSISRRFTQSHTDSHQLSFGFPSSLAYQTPLECFPQVLYFLKLQRPLFPKCKKRNSGKILRSLIVVLNGSLIKFKVQINN